MLSHYPIGRAYLALCVCCGLACSKAASTERGATTSALPASAASAHPASDTPTHAPAEEARREPPAQPARTAAATAAVDPTTTVARPTLSNEELIGLIANRQLWPLGVTDVETKLNVFGPWTRNEPIPYFLEFRNEQRGRFQELVVAYRTGDKNSWEFDYFSMLVEAPAQHETFAELAKLFRAHLGKPKWQKRGRNETPAAGWHVVGEYQLLLDAVEQGGQNFVHISIGIPDGP
jgi:hypothetical protein